MKIKVTNLNNKAAAVPGITGTVPAGTTVEFPGQNKQIAAMALAAASMVLLVSTELDAADSEPIRAVATSTADPAGDGLSVAAVGFTLTDLSGTAVAAAQRLGLGVFDDADCTIPSTTATLATASAGTINSGSGTNRLDVSVNPANGQFRCTVSIPATANKTVYVKPFLLPQTTRVIETVQKDTVVFTDT